MIKQLLRNLLKIKIMGLQTTNRQPMERYAAKTEENTAEVVLPGITILLNDTKGIICENGYVYKIYCIKNATVRDATSTWEVQGVTGAASATSTGMGNFVGDIKLSAGQEILGRFSKVGIDADGTVICYAKAGTRIQAA